MAKKQNTTSTSSVQAGTFDGNLTEDLQGFAKKPDEITYARNAMRNTVVGDLGNRTNEPSNYKCQQAPYTIIGFIHVGADEWAVFSTDNTNSEIGLFKEDESSYKTLVNSQLLAFSTSNLIKGVGRTAFNCGRRVYWDDGKNPSRVLDLDDIPWVKTYTETDGCRTYSDTAVLDVEKLRLAPIVKDLAFRVERGSST